MTGREEKVWLAPSHVTDHWSGLLNPAHLDVTQRRLFSKCCCLKEWSTPKSIENWTLYVGASWPEWPLAPGALASTTEIIEAFLLKKKCTFELALTNIKYLFSLLKKMAKYDLIISCFWFVHRNILQNFCQVYTCTSLSSSHDIGND